MTKDPIHRPLVGIGVMILKNEKVLLGKRKNAHGEGEYAFPGGHLEFGESFATCAKRETKEEAGIEISNIRFLLLSNIKTWANKHYVHISLIADWKHGEPKILEPEKNEGWSWYSLDKLPSPMFESCKQTFEAYKSGHCYKDA